jgi:basic amino acid/polyamine antiporter, APA family
MQGSVPSNAPGFGAGSKFSHFFRRKLAQELVDEAYHPDRKLKQALSAFDLVAFGIGAIIGSGIFALAGTAAAGQVSIARDWMSTPIMNFILGSTIGREGAGPAIVISFVVAGFACILAALCYAELASTIPVAGSAYTFSYAALGQLAAWIIGWDLILEYAVGSIAVAVGWSGYFTHFVHGLTGWTFPLWLTADLTTALSRLASMSPEQASLYSDLSLPVLFGHQLAFNIPALAIVALVTTLLVIGIRETALANTAMVIAKVLVVLFFIAVGTAYVNPANWVPFAPAGLAGIMGGAAIVFFAYIGFDAVSATAEEAKNPQRDLPIGIIASLAICTVLYIAVALVLTGILPYKTYAGDAAPVATALAATGQPLAQIIVSLGAVAGMTSVLLVLLLGQPRIFMAMARDRLLPAFFAKVHPKFRTPYIPTIITGTVVGIFAMLMDIGQAAELTNIGTLAAFCLVCAGVILHRKLEPDMKRPFRCPAVPLVPILGVISCFLLMLSLPIITWARFIAWMVLGIIIYLLYGSKNARAHDQAGQQSG